MLVFVLQALQLYSDIFDIETVRLLFNIVRIRDVTIGQTIPALKVVETPKSNKLRFATATFKLHHRKHQRPSTSTSSTNTVI